jgi:membrane associated rhomboid family serine protease
MLKQIIPYEALVLVGIMWIVFVVDAALPGAPLNNFGISPRTAEGLIGIVASPFLHAGLIHIISNTIPLLVLAALLRLSIGSTQFSWVLVLGIIGSGLGTWAFSLGGLVVGASGLVYVLIGFLFADAYFRPSPRSWLYAILSFALYGGALLSLFTLLPHISWAAHFSGLVTGIALAFMFKTTLTTQKSPI